MNKQTGAFILGLFFLFSSFAWSFVSPTEICALTEDSGKEQAGDSSTLSGDSDHSIDDPKTENPETEDPKTKDPKPEDPKTEDPPAEDSIQIVFDTKCSYKLEEKILRAGEPLGELPEPEQDGYIFSGWFLEDGTKASSDMIVTQSTVLYADWQPIQEDPAPPADGAIHITFDTKCSYKLEEKILRAGEPLGELPEPEQDGYIFSGWFLEDGTKASSDMIVTESTVLYADWQPIPEDQDPLAGMLSAGDSAPFAQLYAGQPSTFTSNLANPVIGDDHPTKPGEVMLFKSAKPVPGKRNTWGITLRIEAKNKVNTNAIALVLDKSRRMLKNNRDEIEEAAAVSFVEESFSPDSTLFPLDFTQMLVLNLHRSCAMYGGPWFSNYVSDLRNAVKMWSPRGYLPPYYTNDYVFTQEGICRARRELERGWDNSQLILISSGVPTCSYKLTHPDEYLIDYPGHGKQTSSDAPMEAYAAYPGYSVSEDYRKNMGTVTYDDEMYTQYAPGKYYNHGNSAIAEARYAKALGQRVWTIAFDMENDPVGQDVMEKIASPDSYRTASLDKLNDVLLEIANEISQDFKKNPISEAVKDAVVVDTIAPGFDLVPGSASSTMSVAVEPNHAPQAQSISFDRRPLMMPIDSNTSTPEPMQANVDSQGNRIRWNPGTLTTPIEDGSDILFAECRYTIEINEDILSQQSDENGEYPTSSQAEISFKNVENLSEQANFPVLRVNPVFYSLEKVLEGQDGQVLKSDRNFTLRFEGPVSEGNSLRREFSLNPSTVAKTPWQTDLRLEGTYTFAETSDASDYDVSYYVNGRETPGNQLMITNTGEDFAIKVVNRDKSSILIKRPPCIPSCQESIAPLPTAPVKRVHIIPRTGEKGPSLSPLILIMAGVILLILRKKRF